MAARVGRIGPDERLGPDELVLRVDSLAQAGDLRGAAEASALLLQPLAHGVVAPEVLERVLRAAACLQDACGHAAATSFSSSTLTAARSFLEGAIRCTATSKGSEFSKDPVGAPTLHEALAVACTTGRLATLSWASGTCSARTRRRRSRARPGTR